MQMHDTLLWAAVLGLLFFVLGVRTRAEGGHCRRMRVVMG